MGYKTTFSGAINIVPPLSAALMSQVNAFCEEEHDDGFNHYCDYVVAADGASIEWNGAEKSYYMEDWMATLIEKFFKPNGHVLNGVMLAHGEEAGDIWKLKVTDNRVERIDASITFGDD